METSVWNAWTKEFTWLERALAAANSRRSEARNVTINHVRVSRADGYLKESKASDQPGMNYDVRKIMISTSGEIIGEVGCKQMYVYKMKRFLWLFPYKSFVGNVPEPVYAEGSRPVHSTLETPENAIRRYPSAPIAFIVDFRGRVDAAHDWNDVEITVYKPLQPHTTFNEQLRVADQAVREAIKTEVEAV